jgi:hypothetical protein
MPTKLVAESARSGGTGSVIPLLIVKINKKLIFLLKVLKYINIRLFIRLYKLSL